jgi:hypothetical protein
LAPGKADAQECVRQQVFIGGQTTCQEALGIAGLAAPSPIPTDLAGEGLILELVASPDPSAATEIMWTNTGTNTVDAAVLVGGGGQGGTQSVLYIYPEPCPSDTITTASGKKANSVEFCTAKQPAAQTGFQECPLIPGSPQESAFWGAIDQALAAQFPGLGLNDTYDIAVMENHDTESGGKIEGELQAVCARPENIPAGFAGVELVVCDPNCTLVDGAVDPICTSGFVPCFEDAAGNFEIKNVPGAINRLPITSSSISCPSWATVTINGTQTCLLAR